MTAKSREEEFADVSELLKIVKSEKSKLTAKTKVWGYGNSRQYGLMLDAEKGLEAILQLDFLNPAKTCK